MTEDTITIGYRNQRHLQRKVRAMLVGWGYTVMSPKVRPVKMITLRLELGIPASTLHKLLKRPDCPPFPGKDARRRQSVLVTPDLRAWLKAEAARIKQRDCQTPGPSLDVSQPRCASAPAQS